MKLNIKAFSLACGILWGLGLFCLTWWIIAFDGATGEPTLIGRLYRGYTISPIGSAIGLISYISRSEKIFLEYSGNIR